MFEMTKNVDKIAEAYAGDMGKEMMEASQKRINWISSQTKGESVLDVGCSQGILSVILAREGKQVTGIDICQESIDYAVVSLEQEDATVRQFVDFECVDFVSYVKNKNKKYDSIVMGEILEHLGDPERFIRYAFDYLNDDGVLIITVPFGVNDYHDHKRTYYLTEIYITVSRYFYVHEIKFLGSWLGMVCRKSKENCILLNDKTFMQVEDAFQTHERGLLKQIKYLSNLLKTSENQFAVLKESSLEAENQSEITLRDVEGRLAVLELEYSTLKQDSEVLVQKLIAEAETQSALMQKELERFLEEKKNLIQRHDETKHHYQQQVANNDAMQQELENLNAEIVRNTTMLNELDILRNDLGRKKDIEKKLVTLLDEKEKLEKKHGQMTKQYQQQVKLNNDLSNSKLGRIQVLIWKRRERKRLKKQKKMYRERFKEQIKRYLKKSPRLVALVRRFRGREARQKLAQLPVAMAPSMEKSEPLKFDVDFIHTVEQKLNLLPSSNGSRFYQKSNIKLGLISDEFLYNAYKDVTDLQFIHSDRWQEQIVGCDLLLVAATWWGLNKEWGGIATKGSRRRGIVLEVINHCNANGIPTVFYGKEDPVNYSDFIEIAQHCDYVFTTAEESIPDYKRDCGHDRVYTLMFGINPLYHNPVGSRKFDKLNGVLFSGSWMDKYPERGRDICMLFDGVLAGRQWLKIINRHFYLDDDRYAFPPKYASFISPSLPHDKVQKLHKLYNWAININTVKNSQTMFANRVYELSAAGNLLLSNYSVGVNSRVPVVFTTQDSNEVGRILNSLSSQETQERQSASIRHAMTGNTCFDRYAEICNKIGLPSTNLDRSIAVVVEKVSDGVYSQFKRQTYANKELITTEDLQARYDAFDMITFFDEQRIYEMFYLEDMIAGFKYSNSDYITKDSYYCGTMFLSGVQHDFVEGLHSKYCTVFWRKSFEVRFLLDMSDEKISLPNGYSIDCLHYNADKENASNQNKDITLKYKLSVVLPIYNNGLHLYTKSFSSLLRSSLFNEMEIILVDDGSTDGLTMEYVQYIASRYHNVKTYFFDDGGSGSASRPRNKGVDLSTSDYIVFLDPDDEVWGDAYMQLYDAAINNDCDLVVGNTMIFRKEEKLTRFYYYFDKVYGATLVDGDKKEFLAKIAFTPMNIQSMIIKRDIIVNNNLKQIVGAIGEDSMMSWQLMLAADRILALDIPVCIYYAEREGSVVNSIGSSFFEKHLVLEPYRIKWLQNQGLLDAYMESRFNSYFNNWTLKKLNCECRKDEFDACRKVVMDIFALYKDYYNGKDDSINKFIEQKTNKGKNKNHESKGR